MSAKKRNDASETPEQEALDSTASGIRVIARAADILRILGQNPDGLSIREIGKSIGVPRSTVQRMVEALDKESFVISASFNGGVRLGPGLIALAGLAKPFNVVEIAYPVIRQFAKDVGETVDLTVLDRDKMVVVDQAPGIHPLRAVSYVGGTLPLHCTATGKAVLAALPEEQLAKLSKTLKLERRTSNTILRWDKLERELEWVRKHGFAYDREESFEGITAVGVALVGRSNQYAAVSVPVPSNRFASIEKTLVSMIIERSQQLQKRF
jgi:IclR family acetate operon transcriptional repressor